MVENTTINVDTCLIDNRFSFHLHPFSALWLLRLRRYLGFNFEISSFRQPFVQKIFCKKVKKLINVALHAKHMIHCFGVGSFSLLGAQRVFIAFDNLLFSFSRCNPPVKHKKETMFYVFCVENSISANSSLSSLIISNFNMEHCAKAIY